MSGGHFGYVNESVGREMEGCWEDVELNELFFDLFCGPSASRSYGGLALSLDFYLASDISEEDYREHVASFKAKWLRPPTGAALERYQNALATDYERYAKQLAEGCSHE